MPTSSDSAESPQHGYRGVATPPPILTQPAAVCVALSREAGSRGGSIAESIGRLLGWQVYTQDMIDFLARDDSARSELLAPVPESARFWADMELAKLTRARKLTPQSDAHAVAQMVYTLAAKGQVVLVGRAAGFLLPAATTVHVRIVSPEQQRIGYLAQWLRLTQEEAAAEVRTRDRRRATFLATLSERAIDDPTAYDLVLNSARLGLDGCAQSVVHAVRSKQQSLAGSSA